MLSKKQLLAIHSKAPVPLLIGIGIGFLLANPVAASHPVRWGTAFLLVGSVLHLKAMKW